MDVGNPSNFARIQALYENDYAIIKENIYGESFSDEETREAIREVHDKFGYMIDPHGAVGYLALQRYLGKNKIEKYNGVILETAHPAKFADVVSGIINKEIEFPDRLAGCMKKEKHSVKISSEYGKLKKFLLETANNN